jgi:methenyltetrahydrofolate cyclohydrolase
MDTVADYLAKLASSSATPGGGSAAMFVASTGAALLAMVCRITAQNPKSEEQQRTAERIAAQADQLRDTFLAARSLDEAAFEAVLQAQALPKSTDAERDARSTAVQAALQRASQVPLDSAARAVELLQLVEEALQIANPGLRSDVGCAAEFAGAAIAACAYNVHINHKYMKDAAVVEAQRARLTEIERQAAELVKHIRERLA